MTWSFKGFSYGRMQNSLENLLPYILVGSEKEIVNGFSNPNMAVAFFFHLQSLGRQGFLFLLGGKTRIINSWVFTFFPNPVITTFLSHSCSLGTRAVKADFRWNRFQNGHHQRTVIEILSVEGTLVVQAGYWMPGVFSVLNRGTVSEGIGKSR